VNFKRQQNSWCSKCCWEPFVLSPYLFININCIGKKGRVRTPSLYQLCWLLAKQRKKAELQMKQNVLQLKNAWAVLLTQNIWTVLLQLLCASISVMVLIGRYWYHGSPQEEYEDYSMFLKSFEDEQSCPCRAVCDFIRKMQQGWKTCWFILLAVRIVFAAHWRKSCFFSVLDGLDCPVRLEPKQEVCDAWAVLYRSVDELSSLKNHLWLPTWPIHSWPVTSAN